MNKLLLGIFAFWSLTTFAADCVVKTSDEVLSTFPDVAVELQERGFVLDTTVSLDRADYELVTSTYEKTHCYGCQFPRLIAHHVRVLKMTKLLKSNDGRLFNLEVASGDGVGRYGGYSFPTIADRARANKKAKREFLRMLKDVSCD